jgi:hypothetical protein
MRSFFFPQLYVLSVDITSRYNVELNQYIYIFIPSYITILWSIFDLKKLMTYLFWSSMKTIN